MAMTAEFFSHLARWDSLDTRIVITAALAAMACALPGNYLVLRRQSMMGDALSHTVLLGLVLAFLFMQWLRSLGFLAPTKEDPLGHSLQHAVLFVGAMGIGVVAALCTEWIQKLGNVEASAALGVVFTTFFAAGLLLLRLFADNVHIDPDCVLYGSVETVVLDNFGQSGIPRAAIENAVALSINLLLVTLFYKELRISAFDPGLATTLGINARLMHYGLMALTAATVVSAFESVGSILVIAMLIVPPATAYLLTDRLGWMLVWSQAVAAASAVLGHALAIAAPPVIFARLGYPEVRDASTSGMTAVAAGMLFAMALLFAPRYGVISKLLDQRLLSLRILREDLLGLLYRLEELQASTHPIPAAIIRRTLGVGRIRGWIAVSQLKNQGFLVLVNGGVQLSATGRQSASSLVRSHRLWESYMARHFSVADNHLHETASRVEHFLNPRLRAQLADELDAPAHDPHGRAIPPEA